MTTNRLYGLDPALIRPGRIDLQVAFTLATRKQIREMYERMYDDTQSSQSEHAPRPALRPQLAKIIKIEPKRLGGLAHDFAQKLPEETFSPAEVQSFLLENKRDAMNALRDVEAWRDRQLETREHKAAKLTG
jgi:chaperone BCS1